MAMQKAAFEGAIWEALRAKAKAGTKWAKLEKVFGDSGLRGSGALNNDPAERKTRIRQLLTRRTHPGFTTEGYSRHCVFVMSQDAATKQAKEADYLSDFVVRDILSERPALPPAECMETVLVIRHDKSKGEKKPESLTPLLLLE